MPHKSSNPGFATAADRAACRRAIRHGSRSFFAASLLLPERIRDPAIALYAFCRLADDAVDLHGGRMPAIEALRNRLCRAYDGRPAALPVDRSLADVVARFDIPKALPEALLDGIAWDADGRRYETLADLHAYAARVAGTVGAMMSILMGAREPGMVARACDLGVAMQLTNIARDVGEDARTGRLYLPRQWLRDAGIDPDAWLAEPVFDEALASVVRRLLQEAEMHYQRADGGIAGLPLFCRPGIVVARSLYREIGREVARRGFDSVSSRAVVSPMRKLGVLCQAILAPGVGNRPATPYFLPETRFLVEAVSANAGQVAAPSVEATPSSVLDDRIGWVIDLFDRLERRDRLARDTRAG